MAVQTSKQLFARRQELASNQASLMAEGNEDDARVVEGQIRELDRTLEHVLDEEERLRARAIWVPRASMSLTCRRKAERRWLRGWRGASSPRRRAAASEKIQGLP